MPKYYREYTLTKQADPPTLKLINDWHTLCKEKIGVDIEIMVADRHEHPKYKNFKGTMNFALPNRVNGRIIYGLYLDNLNNVEPEIISHELCHPLLKLMGLKSMRNDENVHSREENYLNTLCDHPLVYEEQRKYGHSPNNMINEKAMREVKFLSRKHINLNDDEIIIISLNISDSVYNSPRTLSRKILRKAKKYNRKIYDTIILINNTMKRNDVLNYDSNLLIRQNILKELSIKGNWTVRDDYIALKNLCKSE